MSDKITGLGAQKLADGGGIRWTLLYTFDIAPAIQDANGSKINPQISANIAVEHLLRYSPDNTIRQALKDAVDAGDAGYHVVHVDQTSGEGNAAFQARLKLHWTAIRDSLVQVWREKYQRAGTAIDPTV